MATGVLDVEDESILAAIFKDLLPDSWRGQPDVALYLAELSSYGIDKLGREPDRLAEERAHILEQTQDLAFHNYKTFIKTAECSQDIFEDFSLVEERLENLLEKLPVFGEKCQSFLKHAQDINTRRRMNSLTLAHHTQLLEILEMPQLMDTCVRNGYYEEALELAAHVSRLEKKHSNIPVIMDIVREVSTSTALMLSQLIQQLRTNIQLPACLKIIGYLRRMGAFSEVELRIKFLQARDTWYKGILQAIPRDDPYHHITKVIEASRVHLFDIMTQYRAIFSDEDPVMSTIQDNSPSEGALFYGWVVQKVSDILQMLEEDLQQGVGSRLDSLLGQCMYFGLSFSRVGADFRALIIPLFQQAAMRNFVSTVQEATGKFQQDMEAYTLVSIPGLLSGTVMPSISQSGVVQLPMGLLEFPPLAAYCNGLLTGFNELRLCAPIGVVPELTTVLQTSLCKAADVILAFHRAEESAMSSSEKELFGQLCSSFAHSLVPFVNSCLQVMYPAAAVAQVLGIPTADVAKLSVCAVDVETITQPLQDLLPATTLDTTGLTSLLITDIPEASESTRAADSSSIAQSSMEQLPVTGEPVTSAEDVKEPDATSPNTATPTDTATTDTATSDTATSDTATSDTATSDTATSDTASQAATASNTQDTTPETTSSNTAPTDATLVSVTAPPVESIPPPDTTPADLDRPANQTNVGMATISNTQQPLDSASSLPPTGSSRSDLPQQTVAEYSDDDLGEDIPRQ
ncbi:PREDICTED: conserved oligomeric Golgi complex subunit 8-like isoform X2 [Branchiostoma belcheri]|uniref:Conserved oligomeric Golgi complex subunit 8 n=1 Tax=Branchiostoma belcheri TaxID=7741 RepID=A0A6P5AHG9_BRABE|nr:PREDICTED: conserved oligomeric Golgi complex subunit 8-like isoform X1 [Branchiostoma belcheri]XP_019641306.1 PREDICTED: conserved oligomeric Golgi complex subunit 8-like isoform X2 [Branchiostoma belcheri]